MLLLSIKEHSISLLKAKEYYFGARDAPKNGDGYTHERTGKKIHEAATTIEFDTDNLDAVEEFSAIMGALAPEVQETTLAGRNIGKEEENSSSHTADRIVFKVDAKDFDAALKFAQESGFDFSSDVKTSEISTLNFMEKWFDEKRPTLFKNISTFVKSLEQNGIKSNSTSHAVESRLIDTSRRREVLQRVRDKARLEQGRDVLLDALQKAEKRNEDFAKPLLPIIPLGSSLSLMRKTLSPFFMLLEFLQLHLLSTYPTFSRWSMLSFKSVHSHLLGFHAKRKELVFFTLKLVGVFK